MTRWLVVVLVAAGVFTSSAAQGMPLPPALRGHGAEPGKPGAINVKVRRIEQIKPISTTAPAPRSALVGKHRMVVLLAQTRDAKFAAGHGQAYTRQRFFAAHKPSISHFYSKMSYGLYQLQGQVIGPFDFPGSINDYAYSKGASTQRVQRLIRLAFERLTETMDLKRFDTHNQFGQKGRDGIIDHFAVVFPGPAGASGNEAFRPIWPHRGTLSVTSGGWKLGSYFVTSDTAPLGTLVHEYGHDIGLPDLYDRDDTSHGVGDWSTMGSGGWLQDGALPGHLSAWGKIKMGWIRPTVMTGPRNRVEIPAVELNPVAIKIPVGEINSPEYFILENRQRIDYDVGLPDHGLLIWHVNEASNSNDDEHAKLVDVEEAAQDQDLDVYHYGKKPDGVDTYRAGRLAVFDDSTSPAARSQRGNRTGISVANISTSGGVMTADFNVPTIRDPGGEPHRIVYDNYNFGKFSNLSFGAGAERLVRFVATEGAYEIHGFEALFMGRPRSVGRVTIRVYAGDQKIPQKLLFEKPVDVRFGADTYRWLKVRTGLAEGIRIRGKQSFWVGVEHHDRVTGLTHNSASISKRSFFRMRRRGPVTGVYNRNQQMPDFILRVDGYGFIGTTNKAGARQADESDPLVKEMRAIDKILDAKKYTEATARYQRILPKLEKQSSRYSTWIPVLHNSLGVAAYQAKEHDIAIEYFLRSLKKAQLADDVRAEADILENIGETSFHAGQLAQARKYCRRSEALNGDRPGRLMENKYWLGRIHWALREHDKATSYLEQVMPLVIRVHRKDAKEQKRWQARVARAKAGKAVGEDNGSGEPSRLLREHKQERELESGKIQEKQSEVWQVDLSDFGLDGLFDEP